LPHGIGTLKVGEPNPKRKKAQSEGKFEIEPGSPRGHPGVTQSIAIYATH